MMIAFTILYFTRFNRPSSALNPLVSTRANTFDRWSTPVNLGAPVNSGFGDRGPALSFDGKTLYFASARPGGLGKSDPWVATRTKVREPERDDEARRRYCRGYL
jgi:hypothetical protein